MGRTGKYLLREIDAYLVENLLEDLVALFLLILETLVHDVVDSLGHYLLLHVHRRALLFELLHDPLDLGQVEPAVHRAHCLVAL